MPVDAVPSIVHEVLRSPGQPLDAETRALMEPRFGQDFGEVRIHADAPAAESARVVNAQAYTVGPNVVFEDGQYAPDSLEGQRLLAHELVHVLQQRDQPAIPTRIGAPDNDFEREADQIATSVLRDGRLQSHSMPSAEHGVVSKVIGPIVARQVDAGTPVSSPASTTVFTPGVNHDHRPSGRWADVQANPNSGFWENLACKFMSPMGVVREAIDREFSDKPIALQHLNWYLSAGAGADFAEDANIETMLRTDTGVQKEILNHIPSVMTSGTFADHFKLEQMHYTNQDLRFAFGAIDRLDFEVDFGAGTIHVWFQDRYEWHPVYPFYSSFPDDVARETNCVHAALVELKAGTARDYWMKGEATVPLSILRSGATAGPPKKTL